MALRCAVGEAIEQLQSAFPRCKITVTEDGEGGANVIIESVRIDTSVFVQETTWIGFHLSFQLPYADVYPIYVRADLKRKDGQELTGEAFHPNHDFQGRASLMLSRRSNSRDPEQDRPHLKVIRVLDWLRRWPN